jgi:hypothetical protein
MLVTKNDYGAWCISGGSVGHRQYYGFTKREAIRQYTAECKATHRKVYGF